MKVKQLRDGLVQSLDIADTRMYLPDLAHILPSWRSYVQKPRLGFSKLLMVMVLVGGQIPPIIHPDGFGFRILGMCPPRRDHSPGSTPGFMNLVPPILPSLLQRGIQCGQNLGEGRRSSNTFLLILRRSYKKGRQRRRQVEDKIPGCLPRLLASSKPGDVGCDFEFGLGGFE